MQLDSDISILSISALNMMVHDLLEECFEEIWVEGEISNLIQATSGHYYFTLKDKDAQVKCAFFKGAARYMSCKLTNGQHILAKVKISLYAPRGDYQLIVSRVEEVGDGALQRAFEALKKRLDAEGLFDVRHKKPLPKFPQQIGVVTSPSGAAIRDIVQVLARRFPALGITVYPTLVQGKDAAIQIAQAIELANRHGKCDILIVGRGGGSLEDLWSFNEEVVARAIFTSQIPIVSAVGHEIDFTIADFVADIRAPTPSAAAELVSPDGDAWLAYLGDTEIALFNSIQLVISRYDTQLHHLTKRLQHPKNRLQYLMQRVDELSLRLGDLVKFRLERKKQQLQLRMSELNALSPLATLDRGYAIVKNQTTEKVVHFARDVAADDKLAIRFADASVLVVVAEK